LAQEVQIINLRYYQGKPT
jgi:hypothetical protein